MKTKIKIGPIQKVKTKSSNHYQRVRSQINKMKVGEFFEISEISKNEIINVRAAISYFSKRDKWLYDELKNLRQDILPDDFRLTINYTSDRYNNVDSPGIAISKLQEFSK